MKITSEDHLITYLTSKGVKVNEIRKKMGDNNIKINYLDIAVEVIDTKEELTSVFDLYMKNQKNCINYNNLGSKNAIKVLDNDKFLKIMQEAIPYTTLDGLLTNVAETKDLKKFIMVADVIDNKDTLQKVFYVVCKYGTKDMIGYLLDKYHVETNYMCLLMASRFQPIEIDKYLVEHGATVGHLGNVIYREIMKHAESEEDKSWAKSLVS